MSSVLRPLARRLAAAALALGLPLAAHAGAGDLTISVTPLSDTVTYSTVAGSGNTRALTTFVAYEVRVANVGGNTINNIRFTGATASAVAGQDAVFSSAEGLSCITTNAAGTAVECAIGQLKAGEVLPPFRVFFRAPLRASGNTLPNGSIGADTCTGDCLGFSGTLFYAEGTGGANSVPINSTDAWVSPRVALGTANPTRVKSAVPRNGGEFFTGNAGRPTAADTFASSIVVPSSPASTTAEILERTFDATGGCVNFLTCWESDITVPTPSGATTFNPFLRIVVRLDASQTRYTDPATGRTVRVRIENIVPTYNGIPISMCASGPQPRTDGVPCIANRLVYGNGGNVPEELRGDFEWEFINLVNGTYRLP